MGFIGYHTTYRKVRVTVYKGTGAVSENLTRGIPVFNPTSWWFVCSEFTLVGGILIVSFSNKVVSLP